MTMTAFGNKLGGGGSVPSERIAGFDRNRAGGMALIAAETPQRLSAESQAILAAQVKYQPQRKSRRDGARWGNATDPFNTRIEAEVYISQFDPKWGYDYRIVERTASR